MNPQLNPQQMQAPQAPYGAVPGMAPAAMGGMPAPYQFQPNMAGQYGGYPVPQVQPGQQQPVGQPPHMYSAYDAAAAAQAQAQAVQQAAAAQQAYQPQYNQSAYGR